MAVVWWLEVLAMEMCLSHWKAEKAENLKSEHRGQARMPQKDLAMNVCIGNLKF